MKELRNKVAVVTGGGSGIGEALAAAFAAEGMKVVVADIEEAAARRVAKEAGSRGVETLAVHTDVSDAASVEALAERVYTQFGATHVLCNNAGVLLMGQIASKSLDDWRWVFSVNLFGVVHGIHAFLPRMRAQGGEAHIVNTASVAAVGGEGVYGASKAAVLALSESLHGELAEEGIGVSVLCPSYINSSILGAQRNRPAGFGVRADEPFGTADVTTGLPPSAVAEDTLAAIREGRLYVFTYPEMMGKGLRTGAETRFGSIRAAIDAGVRPDPER